MQFPQRKRNAKREHQNILGIDVARGVRRYMYFGIERRATAYGAKRRSNAFTLVRIKKVRNCEILPHPLLLLTAFRCRPTDQLGYAELTTQCPKMRVYRRSNVIASWLKYHESA